MKNKDGNFYKRQIILIYVYVHIIFSGKFRRLRKLQRINSYLELFSLHNRNAKTNQHNQLAPFKLITLMKKVNEATNVIKPILEQKIKQNS